MSKHTPAPWRVVHEKRRYSSEIRASKGETVASCRPEDAQLIAAAPDLLEIAEGMLKVLDETVASTKQRRWSGEFADRCRAVIELARRG